MNVLVCLKQVPDTDDITWTKENNIDRSNLTSILNPMDDTLLEIAKDIKREHGATVTSISMGPSSARSILQYSIARCADNAILLSDKRFSASDTWATSYIISTAIKSLNLKPDIILCSNSAIDGETGQTPAGIAQFLGFPYISCVKEIIRFYKNENKVLVSQILSDYTRMIETYYPVVLSVKYPREITPPKVFDYVRSQNIQISSYNADDIKIETDKIGITGSKTLVKKAYRVQNSRTMSEITNDDAIKFVLDSFSKKDEL